MRNPLFIICLCVLATLTLAAAPVFAAIELGRAGGDKRVLQETYQREGVAFVAIDEVLAAVGLDGQWDNVDHVFRIDTGKGVAVISPGSDYLRIGERSVKVSHRPRFIGGKLLVSEDFLTGQLVPALELSLQVNNLNPVAPPPPESPLDLLFSLFLQQRPRAVADSQWVVAIDPGHGGQDAGALGQDGITEQSVNLGVALHLQKLLKMRRDAPVIMTRDADYAVSAVQRLETVNNGKADVLLSLHTQAFATALPQGIFLFVAPPKSVQAPAGTPAEGAPSVPAVNASLRLAEALHAALKAGGYQVAPVQERALLPLGQGDLPRVMVEMGFLSNEADLARLRDPARQQLLAKALFDGLENFLKSYQDLQESPSEPGTTPAQQ